MRMASLTGTCSSDGLKPRKRCEPGTNLAHFTSSARFSKRRSAVKPEEFLLRLGETTHVDNPVCDDAHSVQGFLMCHLGNEQLAAVLKRNETSVKQVINRRRE
jgi:hypothetical protein